MGKRLNFDKETASTKKIAVFFSVLSVKESLSSSFIIFKPYLQVRTLGRALQSLARDTPPGTLPIICSNNTPGSAAESLVRMKIRMKIIEEGPREHPW